MSSAADAVTVALDVAVPPEVAFDVFTRELDAWWGRGPRFRLSAETIRDQALAVSGLLSSKMYGPPVKPLQPNLGVSAAFGSGIDWQTSAGQDRDRSRRSAGPRGRHCR